MFECARLCVCRVCRVCRVRVRLCNGRICLRTQVSVCTSVRITTYAWVEGGTRNAHITAEDLGFRVSGLGCRTYQEGAHACNLGRIAKAAKRDHLLDLVHVFRVQLGRHVRLCVPT